MNSEKPKFRVYSEEYISRVVKDDNNNKKNSNSLVITELLDDLADGNFFI